MTKLLLGILIMAAAFIYSDMKGCGRQPKREILRIDVTTTFVDETPTFHYDTIYKKLNK